MGLPVSNDSPPGKGRAACLANGLSLTLASAPAAVRAADAARARARDRADGAGAGLLHRARQLREIPRAANCRRSKSSGRAISARRWSRRRRRASTRGRASCAPGARRLQSAPIGAAARLDGRQLPGAAQTAARRDFDDRVPRADLRRAAGGAAARRMAGAGAVRGDRRSAFSASWWRRGPAPARSSRSCWSPSPARSATPATRWRRAASPRTIPARRRCCGRNSPASSRLTPLLPWFWTRAVGRAGLGPDGGLGAFGAVGHALLIKAHQLAPASALAPFGYTQLLWMIAVRLPRVRRLAAADDVLRRGAGCRLRAVSCLLYEREARASKK